MRKFKRPTFLEGIVKEETYVSWLTNRAKAHVVRDRKRFHDKQISVSDYKERIHSAVIKSKGKDQYTNEPLAWEKILSYHNKMDLTERRKLLDAPSVDHDFKGEGIFNFKICSRKTNSCKNDLSVSELINFCKTFLKNQRH